MAKRRASAKPRSGKSRSPAQGGASGGQMPEADPKKKPFTPFTPDNMDRTVIAIPLLNKLKAEREKKKQDPDHQPECYEVIIDVQLAHPGGRPAARGRVEKLVQEILKETAIRRQSDVTKQGINKAKSALSQQYLFGRLDGAVIEELARRDTPAASDKKAQSERAIYRIWEDFKVNELLTKSVSTVKADAARNSFGTWGEEIVWAVMDSGIDATHPHFAKHDNLNLSAVPPLGHRDFTTIGDKSRDDSRALVDKRGHGTHVAGIIAGEMSATDGPIDAETRFRDPMGEVLKATEHPGFISGMAPKCKLVSLKVLDDEGQGRASNIIAAIEAIQEINGHGRFLRIHGVNMSVGYDFEPEWFACGQSPLCVEVDRLVKSGVAVVVAAGNTGYGWSQSAFRGTVSAGLGLTINDPGNADLAITVGSTHRDMPHVYGVSYFSSKGPTGDGRSKPDLVAPGEKIVSCASGWLAPDDAQPAAAHPAMEAELKRIMEAWPSKTRVASSAAKSALKPGKAAKTAKYKEDSGTSMAAPHVSGAIAAFLSVRREFIGRPERVKEIFLSTATDLKRERYFQGAGLLDLMRAIQSV
jgi:serine protease AprX